MPFKQIFIYFFHRSLKAFYVCFPFSILQPVLSHIPKQNQDSSVKRFQLKSVLLQIWYLYHFNQTYFLAGVIGIQIMNFLSYNPIFVAWLSVNLHRQISVVAANSASIWTDVSCLFLFAIVAKQRSWESIVACFWPLPFCLGHYQCI